MPVSVDRRPLLHYNTVLSICTLFTYVSHPRVCSRYRQSVLSVPIVSQILTRTDTTAHRCTLHTSRGTVTEILYRNETPHSECWSYRWTFAEPYTLLASDDVPKTERCTLQAITDGMEIYGRRHLMGGTWAFGTVLQQGTLQSIWLRATQGCGTARWSSTVPSSRRIRKGSFSATSKKWIHWAGNTLLVITKAQIRAHRSLGSQASARLSTAGSSYGTPPRPAPPRGAAQLVIPGNFSVSAAATIVASSSASVTPEASPELFFLRRGILMQSAPPPLFTGVLASRHISVSGG